MHSLKNTLRTGALAIALAAGAVAVNVSVASADVACNSYSECWHVQEHYKQYPRGLGIHFYGDEWATAHRSDRHYRWMRDQDDDRGYYSRGEWHVFGR